MTHRNAPLTPAGRQKIVEMVLVDDRSQRRVAERLQVSAATVNRWVTVACNGEALTGRSSRPHTCPHQLRVRTQRGLIKLRFTRQWGRTASTTTWVLSAPRSAGYSPATVCPDSTASTKQPGCRRAKIPRCGLRPLATQRPTRGTSPPQMHPHG